MVPVEPTGKGIKSVNGIEDIVDNLEGQLGFEAGVLAVVPNGIGQTTDQQQYLDKIADLGYEVPVVIRDRTSLFEGCWDERCTAIEYIDSHRSQKRDYELDTIAKLENLTTHIEEVGSQ